MEMDEVSKLICQANNLRGIGCCRICPVDR